MTFDFSYVVEYDFDLEYQDIISTTEDFILTGDKVTGFDREAWSLSFQGNKMSMSFPCEDCRDLFIESYERLRAKATDAAPAPSIKRARRRSCPACD